MRPSCAVVKRETGLADLIASSGMLSGVIGRPESAKPSAAAAQATQNNNNRVAGSRQSAAAYQRGGPAASGARPRPSSAPVRPGTAGARSANKGDAPRAGASTSHGHRPQPQKRYLRGAWVEDNGESDIEEEEADTPA